MRLPKNVKDNLYFLLAETLSQTSNLQILINTASSSVAQRISDRHGYSYNLKIRIHDDCAASLRAAKKDADDIYSLRAAEAIATGLETITSLCHDCVYLMKDIASQESLKKLSSASLLEDIHRGIALIEETITEDDTSLALKIGDAKEKLERAYEPIFDLHVKELKKSKQAKSIVSSLFVAQRIVEMAEVLLDISESIMSARFGQPMHTDRFHTLQKAISELELGQVEIEPIAETRSGSGISAITDSNGNGYAAIFKDGNKSKLKEERESVESWHEIYPGLAPKILSYKKKGNNAALLIEHLSGQTFEQIILHESDEVLNKTLKHLNKTLKNVWSETKRKKKADANHMAQLRKRIKSVIDIHPYFSTGKTIIAGSKILSIDELVKNAEKIENEISSPFSVYIHGDFNLDNILFDTEEKKIRFIDLHRSRYQDYTQDVSVFMVSNYRLQTLEKTTRRRIKRIVEEFYRYTRNFADNNKDKTFELRLALGLARSFITSTRFILDKTLAKDMFLRGVYILETLTQLKPDEYVQYKLPISELFT